MNAVTVSPKFQVVIPLDMRKRRPRLESGSQLMVLEVNGGLPLAPLKSTCRVTRLRARAGHRDPQRTRSSAVTPTKRLVPVLTVYEVFEKLAREAGEDVATAALSLMQRGHVVDIDLALSLKRP